MGFMDSIGGFLGGKKSGANNPSQNNNLNQLQNEQWMRENTLQRDPMYVYDEDKDNDGITDALETKHHKSFGDGNPRPDKLKPFSFKKPRKDYNQSFDNKGKYVVTATYPLPPLSHQKKMLDRNKKLRNQDNKFF